LTDGLRGSQLPQRLQGRHDNVDRIRAAERLRQDVADAGRLDDGTDRASGDDTRPLGCGTQDHLRRPEIGLHPVRDRAVDQGHEHHVFLGVLAALGDGTRDLVGLAEPGTDVTAPVADDDDRRERETPSAFHDLGHPVDLHHPFSQLQTIRVNTCHLAQSPALPETRPGWSYHRKTRPSRAATDLLADALVTPGPAFKPAFSRHFLDLARRRADLAGLARLAADVLAGVLDTLRFVRVRDAETADLRRDLTDDLFVHARDLELLRRLDRERDAGRRIDLDRVREPERELELLAL